MLARLRVCLFIDPKRNNSLAVTASVFPVAVQSYRKNAKVGTAVDARADNDPRELYIEAARALLWRTPRPH